MLCDATSDEAAAFFADAIEAGGAQAAAAVAAIQLPEYSCASEEATFGLIELFTNFTEVVDMQDAATALKWVARAMWGRRARSAPALHAATASGCRPRCLPGALTPPLLAPPHCPCPRRRSVESYVQVSRCCLRAWVASAAPGWGVPCRLHTAHATRPPPAPPETRPARARVSPLPQAARDAGSFACVTVVVLDDADKLLSEERFAAGALVDGPSPFLEELEADALALSTEGFATDDTALTGTTDTEAGTGTEGTEVDAGVDGAAADEGQ